MISIKTLALFVLSGVALARPQKPDCDKETFQRHHPWHHSKPAGAVAVETTPVPSFTTVTVDSQPTFSAYSYHTEKTVSYKVATTFSYHASAIPTTSTTVVHATSTTSKAPVQTTSTGSSSGGGVNAETGVDWLAVANSWRAKIQKTKPDCPTLKADPLLIERARLSLASNHGKTQFAHQDQDVPSGYSSMAEVAGGGTYDDNTAGFENVFEQGWLCELPNDPWVQGQCTGKQVIPNFFWEYTETGHAEILACDNGNLHSLIGCWYDPESPMTWACRLGSKF